MQRLKWVLALAGLVSLATAANATTYYSCAAATDTWCFVPTSNGQVSDGTNYSTGLGTISVYSETVTLPDNNYAGYGYAFSNPELNGMFAVNDNTYQEGEGIAPYNPTEGGAPFSEQQGIADFSAYGYNLGNILLLQLGSDIAQGTTLNFLLQAGIGASSDYVSGYYQDGGTINLGTGQGISPSNMTLYGTTTLGEISTFGTTAQPQLTLTKNTSGVEWVAIEADCHYLLLSSITGTAPMSGVPEPRFYGLLLASLLGIAGVVYQRRRSAPTIA